MSKQAYILLGSNINPHENMKIAIKHLSEEFEVTSVSRIYKSKPVRKESVEDYLNAVVGIETDLSPTEIKFDKLRPIEDEMGRVRTNDKYKPRKIDLDLILWGTGLYRNDDAGLILPDPEIREYAHIAIPLANVAPDFVHPITGSTIREIADNIESGHSVQPVKLPIS